MEKPFNLNKWIDENRSILKPPIGNKNLYAEVPHFLDFKYVLNQSEAGKKAQKSLKNVVFHVFSLIFIVFHWFSLAFVDNPS